MFENYYKDFLEWILGTIEDSPIPYEIKSLVFFVNDNFEIGFFGSENEKIKKIEIEFFFPLDAEYYFNQNLYKYFKRENNVENCLNFLNITLKKLKKEDKFKEYNFFYGKLFDLPIKI